MSHIKLHGSLIKPFPEGRKFYGFGRQRDIAHKLGMREPHRWEPELNAVVVDSSVIKGSLVLLVNRTVDRYEVIDMIVDSIDEDGWTCHHGDTREVVVCDREPPGKR